MRMSPSIAPLFRRFFLVAAACLALPALLLALPGMAHAQAPGQQAGKVRSPLLTIAHIADSKGNFDPCPS